MTFTELLNNNRDVRDIVGPDVGCSIKAMLIINKTNIAFLFAQYHCCDMTKMIAFAQLILPEVKKLIRLAETFSTLAIITKTITGNLSVMFLRTELRILQTKNEA